MSSRRLARTSSSLARLVPVHYGRGPLVPNEMRDPGRSAIQLHACEVESKRDCRWCKHPPLRLMLVYAPPPGRAGPFFREFDQMCWEHFTSDKICLVTYARIQVSTVGQLSPKCHVFATYAAKATNLCCVFSGVREIGHSYAHIPARRGTWCRASKRSSAISAGRASCASTKRCAVSLLLFCERSCSGLLGMGLACLTHLV